MIRAIIAIDCLLIAFKLCMAEAEPPTPPQQPFMIRHTNLVTNVVITVTTTISEIPGFKVDSQFFPLRTNLMFRYSSNVWTSP